MKSKCRKKVWRLIDNERIKLEKERTGKHALKVLTVKEVGEAYRYQRKKTDWTFYNERKHLEDLLQTRFNFLIAAYALFLLSFVQTDDKCTKTIILVFALVVVILLSITIFRIYVKLEVILKILYKLDKHHVFPIQKREVDARKCKLGDVNPIIGWIIPIFLIVSIGVMLILLWHCSSLFNVQPPQGLGEDKTAALLFMPQNTPID